MVINTVCSMGKMGKGSSDTTTKKGKETIGISPKEKSPMSSRRSNVFSRIFSLM